MAIIFFNNWLDLFFHQTLTNAFPGGSVGKEFACNAGDLGSIPGLGTSPGGGHGNPLHYSCLKNPMDRGASWLQAMGCKELDTTERLLLPFQEKQS